LDKEWVQKLNRDMQRKEEWLQEKRIKREKKVELGKEKDCNRDMLYYMHQLEQRLEVATDNRWKEVALYYSTTRGNDSLPDNSSEDEKPASPLHYRTPRLPYWSDALEHSSHRSVECPQTETDEEEHKTSKGEDQPLILPDLTNPII
ncbi:unnamed protein product, partial [Coregonus sp. 'balchen']